MIYYFTNKALTQGIWSLELEAQASPSGFLEFPVELRHHLGDDPFKGHGVYAPDWHTDYALQLRDKQIEQLRAKLSRLEALSFGEAP